MEDPELSDLWLAGGAVFTSCLFPSSIAAANLQWVCDLTSTFDDEGGPFLPDTRTVTGSTKWQVLPVEAFPRPVHCHNNFTCSRALSAERRSLWAAPIRQPRFLVRHFMSSVQTCNSLTAWELVYMQVLGCAMPFRLKHLMIKAEI